MKYLGKSNETDRLLVLTEIANSTQWPTISPPTSSK